MAVIYEPYIICECGCHKFKKEERLTFHKNVMRKPGADELQPLTKEIVYVCTKCGKELDK